MGKEMPREIIHVTIHVNQNIRDLLQTGPMPTFDFIMLLAFISVAFFTKHGQVV
jgi:hypothetical protein